MRALQFTKYGGPEVLEWAEAPEPHAGPGQIRIAVRAASVNPIDWKMISGMTAGGKPMDGVGYLGFDAAGVVDEVGEGVTGVSVGDDVLGRGRNTQAEFAVLDSWAAKAPSIDWAVAAAAGVAGETGERGLRLLGALHFDDVDRDAAKAGIGDHRVVDEGDAGDVGIERLGERDRVVDGKILRRAPDKIDDQVFDHGPCSTLRAPCGKRYLLPSVLNCFR